MCRKHFYRMKWTKSLLVQILNVTRLSKITVPLRDSLEIKQLLIFFPAVDECCKSIAMMTLERGMYVDSCQHPTPVQTCLARLKQK